MATLYDIKIDRDVDPLDALGRFIRSLSISLATLADLAIEIESDKLARARWEDDGGAP